MTILHRRNEDGSTSLLERMPDGSAREIIRVWAPKDATPADWLRFAEHLVELAKKSAGLPS